MTRPCSSAWTRCVLPGVFRYAPSWAGTGLCGPDVGGAVLYFTGFSVWPRPSIRGLWSVQPAVLTEASRSLTLRAGMDPDGHEAALALSPEPPPDAAAITTIATTTAATSPPATT